MKEKDDGLIRDLATMAIVALVIDLIVCSIDYNGLEYTIDELRKHTTDLKDARHPINRWSKEQLNNAFNGMLKQTNWRKRHEKGI